MSKIALITNDQEFITQAIAIGKTSGLGGVLVPYLTTLQDAVGLAQKLRHEDFDAIVARFGMAMMLDKADLKIPVVEVRITGQDLLKGCLDAQQVTGLSCPKAAFVAFDNMVTDFELIAQVTGVNITLHQVNSIDEISSVVDDVSALGYDVILGGKDGVAAAQSLGHKAVLLHSGDLSLRQALLQAKKVSLGRQIEKENAQKFRALVDFSPEGIISINRERVIETINPAAARLIDCDLEAMIGKPLEHLVSLPGIARCLEESREIRGEVIQINSSWMSLCVVPIVVETEAIGAFLSFQEVSRVQEAEATIRNEILSKKFSAKYALTDILGRSPQLTEAKRVAREIAKTDASILIQGESGTGKELFAQGIHHSSARRHGPFVAINCAALPPNLLESELFGYVEGAFTGATRKGKPGLFEMAHQGTLFLDEISEMDKYGQSRLLRALQERQIMRLGGDKYIPVDVRIIAASNRNLPKLIEQGLFRQDLYHRIRVLVLNLPRLNQRTGDVDYLARTFMKDCERQYKKSIELTPDAYQALVRYRWPGNVRELSHFMARLVITSDSGHVDGDQVSRLLEDREYEFVESPVDDEDIVPAAKNVSTTNAETERKTPVSAFDLELARNTAEGAMIQAALNAHEFNIKQTAQALRMTRPTLYRKMKQLNLQIRKTL